MGDAAMAQECPFQRLGDDELHHIFTFLDSTQLCVAADVCCRWRKMAEPFFRADYLSIHPWHRNPVPRGRWKEADTERGPDDDKEPSWRRLYKAHHVVERNWRRGAYTITEATLPSNTFLQFELDDARGVICAIRMVDGGRKPHKEQTNIEINKRTLMWQPASILKPEGYQLPFQKSEVGRFAVVGLGKNNDAHLVLRPGILRMFGITPTRRVGEYEALRLPALRFINPVVTIGRGVPFRMQRLKRDTQADGAPSLTLGGGSPDSVRLIPLHDPKRHEIYNWPPEFEAEMHEQFPYRVLVNFDETHVFVCDKDRMLIYERSTREMVCQLELKDPNAGMRGSYPVAVTYQWPEHPPQPVTYRVSQPPLVLEPRVCTEDEIYNYIPHGRRIFDDICPEPCIDSDNLLIKTAHLHTQRVLPQLLIPRYRSVMAGLRSVPASERDAYIRAHMIALRTSQMWITGFGSVIRGHRLLVTCLLHEGEPQNPINREVLFVFDLRDLPTIPLTPEAEASGSGGVPSLVPTVACRGPPLPLSLISPPHVPDVEAVLGPWDVRIIDMDNEAIYIATGRTGPLHDAFGCVIKTIRFDSAIREPL